uniref:Uncharacterized protein n=1 Tax=Fagus sylvatica TaxID=28930 RepID=A0A2N9FSN6_FAGSY
MAANEIEWSLPLSDELPEGLSDELPKGEIPDDIVLRIPDPDERACCSKYEGDVAFYEVDFQAVVHFPLQPFVRELLDYLSLASGQVALNGWRTIISCMVMRRVSSNGREDLMVDEFLFCYEPCQIALSPGFWTFKYRDMETRIVHGLPSSNRSWKGGANTMKLNKGKLRKFAQSREVVAAPVSLKHKKVDEGPLKQVEQSSSRLPIRDAVPLVKAVPLVIMVDVDPSLPADPFEGLNEAMVMSQKCIAVEEDLATLRAKSITDETEMKNSKRAVVELTRDRKEALIELEKVKAELKARDGDVKIEGAKAAAVSKFKVSKAFEDINMRYFLSSFEAFRKQVAERFLDLDFSIFQPYNNEDSVVDGGQDDPVGGDDVTSK